MEIKGLDCAVLGGGIGGLAAALVLRRAGANVRLYEQAKEISEVGAGLQISPNGFVVLRALGLDQALGAVSVRGQAVRLRDYSGRDVLRLDLGRLDARDYYFVHRADLIGVLEQAARERGVDITLGVRITKVTANGTPRASVENGPDIIADLMIGADGLQSRARHALNGTLAPFFTRQVAWRAVVPCRDPAPEAQVFMGPRRHIVTYPMRGGTLRNIVAVEERMAWREEGWAHAGDPDDLRARFADFGAEAQALLKLVDKVHVWGLFRHPVAPTWQSDGLVLVGDAAHPTLPFLAQGANMALEDAFGLARCLEASADLRAALSSYQNLRAPRATRVIEAANGNAWKYHLSFAPLRWAAHTALRLGGAVAPGRMIGQFDWLYGYDITQEKP